MNFLNDPKHVGASVTWCPIAVPRVGHWSWRADANLFGELIGSEFPYDADERPLIVAVHAAMKLCHGEDYFRTRPFVIRIMRFRVMLVEPTATGSEVEASAEWDAYEDKSGTDAPGTWSWTSSIAGFVHRGGISGGELPRTSPEKHVLCEVRNRLASSLGIEDYFERHPLNGRVVRYYGYMAGEEP